MLVFSTAGRPDNEAFARWRAAIGEHFVPLRPEPSAGCTEFFGEVRSWPVGALTLSNVCAIGQRIHRDKPEISRSDREVFFLTVQLNGETGIVCGEDRKLARPGDIYLLDARRPFVLHCEERGHGLSLTIPRRVCGSRLAVLDDLHGLVLNFSNPVGALLRDYLSSVAAVDGTLGTVESEDIANHLIALIGHALSGREADAALPQRTAHAALFAKAHRLIERKLCDPDFDPAGLARDAGVSLRQLQGLFAEHGTSPMRSIFDRRIALAGRMLRDPAHAQKTITQVAFECGFRDLSHFGRVFAAATGLTPRAWRRGGGG